MMLKYSVVPASFGKGIIVPIPKGNKRSHGSLDDYRGITICSVLSKMFEHCLFIKCSKLMKCSDRQFGFKKESSCAHAIYTLRRVVDTFTKNGSTVNIASVDISQAFDRLIHLKLFQKLMERNLPKFFILILINWYSKMTSKVKWGNSFSNWFEIKEGVRQGGVLSPILFAIYVDDIFDKLKSTKRGCIIGRMVYNTIMYCDDLLILTISVEDLEYLIELCSNFFRNIGLEINLSKSACVRIGSRHNAKIPEIKLNNSTLQWKEQIDYLGIQITSAQHFSVSTQRARQKFFAALNGIFCKVGLNTSPAVLISLIEAQCTSILLYASECLCWKKAALNSLENAGNQVYFKIFGTFDKSIAMHCMYYMGQLPLEMKIVKRKIQFLSKLKKTQSASLRALLDGNRELDELLTRYKIDNLNLHDTLQQMFASDLGLNC